MNSRDDAAPPTGESDVPAEAEWERRRRLDAVFGDLVPETTADAGESAHTARGRDWYEQNTPPHHG
ncbi:hypothetical protein GCM10023217_03240 [Gordonia alkaliphila]|uniref:Uncharacterized protein n=1 Tax=Gordonia alkaliphila TaxID=1053547 RepID=A0ABP8YV43_9ACTN